MAQMKRYRHVEDGEALDTKVIVCRPDEWAKLPQSSDPSWLASTFSCGLCVAVRRPVVSLGGVAEIDDR